jgi:hypothetical protein
LDANEVERLDGFALHLEAELNGFRTLAISSSRDFACVWQPRSARTEATK